MAQARRFVCGSCSRAIEAWSDGNSYYIDEDSRKQYAYHPDHGRLARCIGNDSTHLCLGNKQLESAGVIVVDAARRRQAITVCGHDAAEWNMIGSVDR